MHKTGKIEPVIFRNRKRTDTRYTLIEIHRTTLRGKVNRKRNKLN